MRREVWAVSRKNSKRAGSLRQLFSVCHPLGHRNLQNITKGSGRGGQENHIPLCYKVVTRVEFAKGSLHPLRNV